MNMPKQHNSIVKPLTKADLVEVLDLRFGAQDALFDTKLGALEARVDSKFSALETRIDEKVDTLAQAVQQGFSEMGERLGSLEKGQNGLRGDIRRIDIRWSRQQEILDDDREVVRGHGRRLTAVENKVGIIPV
jgi:hypothetical protein